jgi:hypothetical protein
MTEEELEAIRVRHVPAGRWSCRKCGQTCAPCDAMVLGHEIERLRGALERILAAHQEIVGVTRSYCLICAPGDGRWPCVTVLEARAALGVEA